jgi:hypothetical protein
MPILGAFRGQESTDRRHGFWRSHGHRQGALRDKCEELADDVQALSTLVHALRGALVAVGVVTKMVCFLRFQ